MDLLRIREPDVLIDNFGVTGFGQVTLVAVQRSAYQGLLRRLRLTLVSFYSETRCETAEGRAEQ